MSINSPVKGWVMLAFENPKGYTTRFHNFTDGNIPSVCD
jgi:hypothetical protein